MLTIECMNYEKHIYSHFNTFVLKNGIIGCLQEWEENPQSSLLGISSGTNLKKKFRGLL